MRSFRKYGKPPYKVAVVHGGPGAPGQMAPVAKNLSKKYGVLEPFQSEHSVTGQVEELKGQILKHAHPPAILVGWSWGAWLAYIVAARYPELVKKLILVSSGPFEAKYAKNIMDTRMTRLTKAEQKRLSSLFASVESASDNKKNETFSQIGKLIDKADSYKAMPHKDDVLEVQFDVYDKVWSQASEMRESGELIKLGSKIHCPIVAIHGDYDPHPAEGVELPLAKVIKNIKFYLLKNCGHHPWYEAESKDKFFEILGKEVV